MKTFVRLQRLVPRPVRCGLLTLVTIALPLSLRAQTPGSLDPAYQNPATDQPVQVVVAQTDANGVTKAIVAGSFDSLLDNASTPVPAFARFNADGSLDTAFLSKVSGSALSTVTALAVQPNGAFLVAGFANGSRSLLRFQADGTPDPSFQVTVDDDVESIAFQPDGSILISGFFNTVNGTGGQRCLARLSTAGVLDTGFQAFTNNALTVTEVKRVAVLPGGGVLAVTHVSEGGVDYLIQLAAANGAVPDAPTFFSRVTGGRVYDLNVDGTGRVVIVGNFDTIDNHPRASHIARYAANGQLDTNFVGGEPLPSVLLQSVVVDANGQPIVGGVSFFTSALFRLTAAVGLVDSAFSFPLGEDSSYVQGLALQPDGALLVGGQFSIGQRAANLVRVVTGTGGVTTVPGTASIFLAGQPDGTGTAYGDTAPAQSAVRVTGLTLTAGSALTFDVTGTTAQDTNVAFLAPDGSGGGSYFSLNGLSGLNGIGFCALVGVFLTDDVPDVQGTIPPTLDYSDNTTPAGGTNFGTFQPALKQIFFIGDGKDSSSNAQTIVAPPGATRLFLAIADSGNANNLGQLAVVVHGATGSNGGNLIVPGTANPYLAGLPDGTTASGGDDLAPAESPVLVPGLTLHANNPLNFSVAGSVSTDSTVQPTEGPDGGFFFAHAAENSFSKTVAPINSLVGVFLTDAAPDPTIVDSSVRDFSDTAATNGGVNYLGYQPRLGEPFFIGDGLISTGTVQNVFPPVGATRLFLGVLDGNDYFNNLGQFNVGVTQNTDIDTSDLHLGQSVRTPTDSSGAAAQIGDQITYTFHVKNEGSHPFTNVVIKDALPGPCEFVSASDGGTFKSGIVTWNLGTVAPTGTGAAKDLTLVVKTFATGDSGQNVSAAQINQVINNLGYYFTADGLPQAVPGLDLNNSTVLKAPITVAISSDSATVLPGGTVNYHIDLTNTSLNAQKKPVFTLTLPAGVKFVSAAYLDDNGVPIDTVSTDGGVTFTSTAGSFAYNGGGAATLTLANLKGNATAHLVITVLVPYDVEPAAAVSLLTAKLTTKTSDGFGQNAYGIAVPDTKLSAAAVTLLPKLRLTKTTVDPYSLAQLFLFDPKDANSLSKGFPLVPFYLPSPSDPSQKLINPDALISLGQTLNPYIGQDLETGVLTITAPDAKKAPVTYATFALAYENDGNVDTDKIVINDPIPDGFAYDPAGLPTDPALNPIAAPFVLINGQPPTLIPGSNPPAYDKFQVRADGRALIFSLGKAKMGKSGLIIYQLRVTGTSLGQTVQVPRAGLSTDSLNATTYSDSGVGESLQIVGPQSYALEPQNNGNYTRIGDQVNFDLFYTNTGVSKYKDFLIACQVPSGVTFAGSAVLAANGHDVSAAGPAPDTSGRIVFHLGKLKPDGNGFVRVTYTLGAALRTASRPAVDNAWIASEADINDNFPLAAHRLLTRAAQARPGTRAASSSAGNPVAYSTTLVNDPSVPRLFIAKLAPLAVVPDKPYDYLVTVGNLSDFPAGGDVTNTSQGIIATETLPTDVTFVSLMGNSNRSVTVKGNVVTYQIPAILPHVTSAIKIRVKPNAGSTGKTLTSTSQVDIPNGPLLAAKPTLTRVVAASQIALQAASVAGDALTGSGFKSTALPNLGKQLDFSKNMVVCAGADFIHFNNGAILIPQGNAAATLFGDASSISYPANTAIGSLNVSANGGVVAVDASSVLAVHNLADNALNTVVGSAGISCEQIINDLYTGSPNNLVRKSAATGSNGGGLNLYGTDGTSFLNNQPNTVPQTINRAMVLGVKGAVIPAGLANATLRDEGLQRADHLITQDGGGLITQDGGGLISQDGGGLITQDGGGLITQDGGGLITQDGGGLVAQGGGNLVGIDGAKLVAQGGGNAVPTPPDSTLVAQGGGNLVVAGSALVAQGGGN